MFCSLRCQVCEGLGPRLLPSNDKQLYLVWKHTGLSFSVCCGNTEFTAETAKDMWLHMTKPKCLISQFSDALTVGRICTKNTTFLRFLGFCVKTLDMWGLLMFLLKKNTRKIKVPMIERLKKMLRKSLTLKPIWTISRDSLNPCVLWHKHWSTSAGFVLCDTYQQYSNMHFPLLGTRWRTHISVSLAAVCS